MSAAVEHVPGCGEALAARDCDCWKPSRRSRSKRPIVSSDPVPVDRMYWYRSVAENEQQLRVRTYMLHAMVPHWVAALESALLGVRRELDQWPKSPVHHCYTRIHAFGDSHAALLKQTPTPRQCTCGTYSWLDMPVMRAAMVQAFSRWLGEWWVRDREYRFSEPRPGTTITPTSKQPELVRAEVGE